MTETDPQTLPDAQDTVEHAIDVALESYSPTTAAIAELAETYAPLEIQGVEDREGLALVHAARMDVRGKRVAVEKTRKALKADALEFGRRVDGEARRLTGLLEPIEGRLRVMEEAVVAEKAAIAEAEAKVERERLQKRVDAIHATGYAAPAIEVMGWSDEVYEAQLAKAKEAQIELLAREAKEKAEAKRLAKAEAKRVEAEKAELKKQLAQAQAEKARADREAAEARAKEDARHAAEVAKLAKEREELEAEKLRLEEMSRRAEESKAAEAAVQREREQARAESKAAAEHEAELARLAPQKEQIRALAEQLDALVVPDVDCSDRLNEILGLAYDDILEIAGA